MWVQLITMQNDLQKQVSVMVAVPVSKEGKRIEGEKKTSYRSSSSAMIIFNSTSMIWDYEKIRVTHWIMQVR